ncbi:MAG: AAA family ATPase [Blastopirellula sp.]|nr:MAG: AAA family ATPase [Blastopirellula sp.]
MTNPPRDPFIDYIEILHDREELESSYAPQIPAIKNFNRLKLHPKVTFFIGENGSGKSTLLEAIAVAEGFNAEGGTRDFNFASQESHSDIHKWLRLGRGVRSSRSDGFFFRAESFYNVATEIDRQGFISYGPTSYHDQSHGESFLSLFVDKFKGDGLYLLDEPEAALSPQRQLTFLARMHDLVKKDSQLIIATHSPLIMAYPDALIYEFTPDGLKEVAYQETEHFQVTRSFLDQPERMLKHLFES